MITLIKTLLKPHMQLYYIINGIIFRLRFYTYELLDVIFFILPLQD